MFLMTLFFRSIAKPFWAEGLQCKSIAENGDWSWAGHRVVRHEESPVSCRKGRWLTTTGGDPRESAAENIPPGSPGKGEKVG